MFSSLLVMRARYTSNILQMCGQWGVGSAIGASCKAMTTVQETGMEGGMEVIEMMEVIGVKEACW